MRLGRFGRQMARDFRAALGHAGHDQPSDDRAKQDAADADAENDDFVVLLLDGGFRLGSSGMDRGLNPPQRRRGFRGRRLIFPARTWLRARTPLENWPIPLT